MNITDIATHLLQYFSPEERSIPDASDYPGRNGAVLLAINGALQEIFGEGGPWIRKDDRGGLLHEPATVPITVTAGSTAAVIAADDWQDWFAGCAIVISGSAMDNQIRNAERNVRLKFPHDGATGTVDATIYQTSVTVDDDVLRVIDPVKADGLPLAPRPSPGTRVIDRRNDFGFRGIMVDTASPPPRVQDCLGRPRVYAVETWSPDTNTPAKTRLVLFPAPYTAGSLEYEVMLKPPVVTSLTSSETLPIPMEYEASILLPIAVRRLSDSPFFRATDKDLSGSYKQALRLLGSLNPRRDAGVRMIPTL